MKKLGEFFFTNLFFVWLFYVLIISIITIFTVPDGTTITTSSTKNTNYKLIYKSHPNNYTLDSKGFFITDIYVASISKPEDIEIKIGGIKYNVLLTSDLITKLIPPSLVSEQDQIFKIINLSKKTVIKLSRKFPFIHKHAARKTNLSKRKGVNRLIIWKQNLEY